MTEGFQLSPHAIADDIGKTLSSRSASLYAYFDSYARPDWNTGMTMVHDPADRAVIVFVGTREQAAAVHQAAKAAIS